MTKAPLGIRIVLAVFPLFAIGCTPIEPTMCTGAAAEVTHDGLHRVDNAGFAAVWIKPGAGFARYSRILVVKPSFHYRPVRGSGGSLSSEYEVPERQRDRLEEIVTESFAKSLAKSRYYSLTTEPGPEVLLLLSEVHDVVSHLPPERQGRNRTYVKEIGAATVVLELRDSESNEVLARAAERRALAPPQGLIWSGVIDPASRVREEAARWGSRLRDQLDALHHKGSGPNGPSDWPERL